MRVKAKARISILTLLVVLFVGSILLNVAFAIPESIMGTPDDTAGVWLFSAGTLLPADEPTDDIIGTAIFYGILDFIGDTPVEVFDFGWGLTEPPPPGQEDTTMAEVNTGLTTVDDFGYLVNGGDDDANHDTGDAGYFEGGYDPTGPNMIVADGVVTTGVLGPSEAASAVAAQAALGGFEMFIFDDAELSGMNITLSNELGLSINIIIDDLQINPPTFFHADDTLVAIDLDSLVGFDPKVDFIDTIRVEDDGIPQAITDAGDTTLEIDAIATLHAIPEVSLGTIMVLVSMFGSLGVYAVRRKRN
ncbi:MAG: hypothetical protein JSV85_02540 [Candidatus Bathyarchaeota archaeon]|nr:MAG: hypothetical protein JSV85_02540 [Candidatus Bathyarchaeota archaeon]